MLDESGSVIRDALLWCDTSSAPAAEELNDEIGREVLANTVGSVLVASFTVTKLRFIANSEAHNAAKVKAVCLPHDWLTWKLVGGGDMTKLFTDRGRYTIEGNIQPLYITQSLTLCLFVHVHF